MEETTPFLHLFRVALLDFGRLQCNSAQSIISLPKSSFVSNDVSLILIALIRIDHFVDAFCMTSHGRNERNTRWSLVERTLCCSIEESRWSLDSSEDMISGWL